MNSVDQKILLNVAKELGISDRVKPANVRVEEVDPIEWLDENPDDLKAIKIGEFKVINPHRAYEIIRSFGPGRSFKK